MTNLMNLYRHRIIHEFHAADNLIRIRKDGDFYTGQYDGKQNGCTVRNEDLTALRKRLARCIMELRH